MPHLLAILSRAESFLVIALFTIMPLLVSPSTYELFEFPKMMFVYAVTVVLVAVKLSILILKIDDREQKGETKGEVRSEKSVFSFLSSFLSSVFCHPTSKQVLILSFAAFVTANIISTLFSQYQYTSLWGYYSRFSGGLISIICYFIIFLILATWTKEKLLLTLKIAVLTTTIIAIYAIAQHFGLEKDRWVQDVTARVFASFGQPNWLAAFLVLIIPISVCFLIEAKKILAKWGYLVTSSLLFAALWFTFSLSGLLAGAVMMVILLALLNKTVLVKNARWLLVMFAAWILVAFWQPGLAQARFEDALKTINNRLSIVKIAFADSGAYKVGDTSDIRLIVWEGVLESVLASPKTIMVGNGPETVAFSFPPFRPAAMNQTSEQSFLYNKAHNYFLDLLSNLGLLGLGSFLLLNIVAIVVAVRNRHNTLKLAIGVALVGNLVTNFFGWPTVTTNLIFGLYLSFLTI